MHKNIIFILVAALALLGHAQTSQSAVVVSQVTPTQVMTDPGNGFPIYYSDGTSQLVPCLTENPADPVNNPYCVLLADEAFDAVNPVLFPLNFPLEFFYWYAEADTTNLGPYVVKLRFAVEGTFANFPTVPADGWQTVFQRVRLWLIAPGPGTFTVTHPYGSHTFTATAAGELLRVTTDVPGGIPLDFAGVQAGAITNFLRCADCPVITDAAGYTYIGDPLVPHFVTGSPLGPTRNSVTVTGPGIGGPGINSVSTNLFLVAGKEFNGVLPTALSIQRASYSRTAGNAVELDVFATSNAGAAVTYREAGSTIDVPMTADAINPLSARFYGNSTPAAPPASVLVTALTPSATSTTLTTNVTDAVFISRAQFDVACNRMDIDASSSDEFAPLPALTAVGFGDLALRGIAPNQGRTFTQVGNPLVNLVPPAQIKVTSARGGSATELITVLPNTPPAAVNDISLATAGTPTTIDVIANDTDVQTTVDATTVTIVSSPSGTAVANPNGTVTYTPNAGGSRVDTFTYTVKDTVCAPFGTVTATSLPATVSVTVIGVATPPTAGAAAASTQTNTAVTIDLLASVTTGSNPLSAAPISIVPGQGPLNGALVSSGTGTVTYTPNLNFSGSDSFQYTATDNAGLVSNAGRVTITVTSPAGTPPSAGNVAAATLSNTPVTINIVASVVTGSNPVNWATLTIVPGFGPASGSVVSAGTGTVTYTPSLNFIGTDSFRYTVTDTFGLVTNPSGTVTITVQNTPPVASGETANTAQRTAVIINVIANDIDQDGTINPASVAIVSAPSPTNGGTVTVNTVTGTITYTPGITSTGAFFTGADTFTYTVNDNLGATSNIATVTVNVGATAEALTVKTAEYVQSKSEWRISGSSTQRVGNSMTLVLVRGGVDQGTIGTATVSANGSWQFQGASLVPLAGDQVKAISRFGSTSALRAVALK